MLRNYIRRLLSGRNTVLLPACTPECRRQNKAGLQPNYYATTVHDAPQIKSRIRPPISRTNFFFQHEAEKERLYRKNATRRSRASLRALHAMFTCYIHTGYLYTRSTLTWPPSASSTHFPNHFCSCKSNILGEQSAGKLAATGA